MAEVPALLEKARPQIESLLANNQYLTPRRMIMLASHIADNSFGPLKQAISDYPLSFVNAIIQCSDLGLEPNTALHLAALVPFKTKHGKYAIQLIIQYQGYVHLAISSGAAEDVTGSLVYDDEIEEGRFYEDRTNRVQPLVHKPDPRKKRIVPANPADAKKYGVAGAYSLIWLPTGKPKAKYMELSEIEYIREKYSRAAEKESGYSPWETRWSEQAIKTPLRNNMKTMRLIGTAPKLIGALDLEESEYQARQELLPDAGELTEAETPRAKVVVVSEQSSQGRGPGDAQASIGLTGPSSNPSQPEQIQKEATSVFAATMVDPSAPAATGPDVSAGSSVDNEGAAGVTSAGGSSESDGDAEEPLSASEKILVKGLFVAAKGPTSAKTVALSQAIPGYTDVNHLKKGQVELFTAVLQKLQ